MKWFGLPISVILPVYRNVNAKESSIIIVLKGMYIFSVISE